MTAAVLYKQVLQELQQQNTRTMTPKEFVKLFNTEQYEMVYTWSVQNDLRHRNYNEDINCLRVSTNGRFGNPAPLANIGTNANGEEGFDLPVDCLYTEDVLFTVYCLGSRCYAGGTILSRNAKYVKQHELNSRNVYSQGSEDEPLYQLQNRIIVPVIRETQSYVTAIQLTYLRNPVNIEYAGNAFTVEPESGYTESFCTMLIKRCVNRWLEQTGDARVNIQTQIENSTTNKITSL